MIVVGMDPGATGAIAILDSETQTLLRIYDMPTDTVTQGKHERQRISRARLLPILVSACGAQGFVERPEVRPLRTRDKTTGQTVLRQPGAMGMFTFGEGYGILTMAATAASISLTEVRPGVWKNALGLPADKDECRRRAAELFPEWAAQFARKKDDGRAESCLIGLYGCRKLRGL